MVKRWGLVAAAAAAVVLAIPGPPARADAPAPVEAPQLRAYSIDISPPTPPSPPPFNRCDGDNLNYCGVVAIQATFSGVAGLPRPTTSFPNTDLNGSARVRRDYGCESPAGRRLRKHDRRVAAIEPVTTRRGFGFLLPPEGDEVTATAYALLRDRQPGNCPAGTRPMTYKLTVSRVRLTFELKGDQPATWNYALQGYAVWSGAVALPPAADG